MTTVRCWAIDHQPKTLSDCLSVQKNPATLLKGMIDQYQTGFQHLFIYGLPGGGKRTLISCFLQDLYNHHLQRVKKKEEEEEEGDDKDNEHDMKDDTSKKSILKYIPTKLKEDSDLHILKSEIDLQISMDSMKLQQAQTILFEYLEDIGKNRYMKLSTTINDFPYLIIWLKECSNMSYVTQKAIGILMEAYGHKLKFILTSNHFSDIEPSLVSRCQSIHVPLPTHEIILNVLESIIEKEDLQPETMKPNWINMCSRYSERNLQTAIHCFQSTYYSIDGILAIPQWKKDLFSLCDHVVEDCSTEKLNLLLLKLEEYISSCYRIPPTLLLQIITNRFLQHKKLTDSKKYSIMQHCALIEHRMKTGLNPIVHLATFCCQTCFYFE